MFHFTRHLVSPIAGAQFPLLNVGCLFTVQCESPVLFPKRGNISQPDQCFHPQHGATYHMSRSGSQKKREGGRQPGGPSSAYVVTHTQEKHFQSPKCQWTITVGRLMHRGNMRAQGCDVRKANSIPAFLGYTFEEDLRPGVKERSVKVPELGGQSPSTEPLDF